MRNDIERLRTLGYQVQSSSGTTGGYRLGAGAALPPLLLDDDEAIAVAVGLRAAAAGSVTGIEETSLRALTKLEHTMPSRLRSRLDALRQATVSAAGGGPTVDADTLATLAGACRDTQQLRFDYQGRDGEDDRRRVEPHRLVYTGRRWYLLAWDLDRQDWRTFRAARVRPRLPTGPRFRSREPPEDAARHVVRGTGSLAWEHPARIRLHACIAAIADRVPPAAGLLRPIDEHSCLLDTGSDSLNNLVGYLTGLDVAFDVLDPPELRTLLLKLAARYTAAAGNPIHLTVGRNGRRRHELRPRLRLDGLPAHSVLPVALRRPLRGSSGGTFLRSGRGALRRTGSATLNLDATPGRAPQAPGGSAWSPPSTRWTATLGGPARRPPRTRPWRRCRMRCWWRCPRRTCTCTWWARRPRTPWPGSPPATPRSGSPRTWPSCAPFTPSGTSRTSWPCTPR